MSFSQLFNELQNIIKLPSEILKSEPNAYFFLFNLLRVKGEHGITEFRNKYFFNPNELQSQNITHNLKPYVQSLQEFNSLQKAQLSQIISGILQLNDYDCFSTDFFDFILESNGDLNALNKFLNESRKHLNFESRKIQLLLQSSSFIELKDKIVLKKEEVRLKECKKNENSELFEKFRSFFSVPNEFLSDFPNGYNHLFDIIEKGNIDDFKNVLKDYFSKKEWLRLNEIFEGEIFQSLIHQIQNDHKIINLNLIEELKKHLPLNEEIMGDFKDPYFTIFEKIINENNESLRAFLSDYYSAKKIKEIFSSKEFLDLVEKIKTSKQKEDKNMKEHHLKALENHLKLDDKIKKKFPEIYSLLFDLITKNQTIKSLEDFLRKHLVLEEFKIIEKIINSDSFREVFSEIIRFKTEKNEDEVQIIEELSKILNFDEEIMNNFQNGYSDIIDLISKDKKEELFNILNENMSPKELKKLSEKFKEESFQNIINKIKLIKLNQNPQSSNHLNLELEIIDELSKILNFDEEILNDFKNGYLDILDLLSKDKIDELLLIVQNNMIPKEFKLLTEKFHGESLKSIINRIKLLKFERNIESNSQNLKLKIIDELSKFLNFKKEILNDFQNGYSDIIDLISKDKIDELLMTVKENMRPKEFTQLSQKFQEESFQNIVTKIKSLITPDNEKEKILKNLKEIITVNDSRIYDDILEIILEDENWEEKINVLFSQNCGKAIAQDIMKKLNNSQLFCDTLKYIAEQKRTNNLKKFKGLIQFPQNYLQKDPLLYERFFDVLQQEGISAIKHFLKTNLTNEDCQSFMNKCFQNSDFLFFTFFLQNSQLEKIIVEIKEIFMKVLQINSGNQEYKYLNKMVSIYILQGADAFKYYLESNFSSKIKKNYEENKKNAEFLKLENKIKSLNVKIQVIIREEESEIEHQIFFMMNENISEIIRFISNKMKTRESNLKLCYKTKEICAEKSLSQNLKLLEYPIEIIYEPIYFDIKIISEINLKFIFQKNIYEWTCSPTQSINELKIEFFKYINVPLKNSFWYYQDELLQNEETFKIKSIPKNSEIYISEYPLAEIYCQENLIFKEDIDSINNMENLINKAKKLISNENISIMHENLILDEKCNFFDTFDIEIIQKGIKLNIVFTRTFIFKNNEKSCILLFHEESSVLNIWTRAIKEYETLKNQDFTIQHEGIPIPEKDIKISECFNGKQKIEIEIIVLANIEFISLDEKLILNISIDLNCDKNALCKAFNQKFPQITVANQTFLIEKKENEGKIQNFYIFDFFDEGNRKINDIKLTFSLHNFKIHFSKKEKIKFLFSLSENNFLHEYSVIPKLTVYENKKLLFNSQNIFIEPDKQVWILDNVGEEMEDKKKLEFYTFNNSKFISMSLKVDLNICYETTHLLKNISPERAFINLKEEINHILHIPANQQKWFFKEFEMEDEMTLLSFIKKYKIFDFDLFIRPIQEHNSNHFSQDIIIPVNLALNENFEFYGFTFGKTAQDLDMNYHDFYFEDSEVLEDLIKRIHFTQKNEEIFFRKEIVSLFYNRLKKQSLWKDLVHKFRKLLSEKKEDIQIWKSQNKNKESLFNNLFILHNLLLSGNQSSRFKILNTAQRHMPVPLFLNEWGQNFLITEKKFINEFYWIINQSFTISSFGIGRMGKESCGKSHLLNTLFFTQFFLSSSRHPVCKNIPEIKTNIYYNDQISVNLIDIPSNIDEEILQDLALHSNLLIIHCHFEDRLELKNFEMNSEFKHIPKIVIVRDMNGAFDKLKEFKSKITNSFNSSLEKGVFSLEIESFKSLNYDDYLENIDFLINYFHKFLFHISQTINNEEFWKFHEYLDKKVNSIPTDKIFNLLKSLENKNEDLTPIAKIHTEYIKLIRNLDQQKLKLEINEKEEKLQTMETTPEIMQIFEVLNSENVPVVYCLNKICIFLRFIMTKKTKKMYELYDYKNKIEKDPNNEQTLNNLKQYWEKIKKSSSFFEAEIIPIMPTEILQFIKKNILIFEKNILSGILSSELIWRELIYLATYQENSKVKKNSNDQMEIPLLDKLKEFMKEYILDGNPFEIIDGDSLYMAKEFLKGVFKSRNETVLVISVLGPQSSGKSTLLNFIFGCDFMTSTGRCTKGIYGTYIKSTNFSAYDSILILDTEGLLSIMESSEKEERMMFDRKVCLFALAVSDFVFLNTKGDMDSAMSDIFFVCMNSLYNLKKGNMSVAEIYLVLNQNQDTKIENHLLYIDKVFNGIMSNLKEKEDYENNIKNENENQYNEIINEEKQHKMGFINLTKDNVEVLPSAYDDKVYGKDKIPSLEERILIRTPKNEFHDKTSDFCQRILKKAKERQSRMTIEEVIENMEKTWEMISKYPELVKPIDLQSQKKEKRLDQYISETIDNLSRSRENFFKEIKDYEKILNGDQEYLESAIKTLWKQKENQTISEFEKTFRNLNYDKFMIDNFKNKKLHPSLNNIYTQFLDCALRMMYNKKIRNQSFYGEQKINILINQILRDSEKSISDGEKKQKFQSVWSEILNEKGGKKDKMKDAEVLFNHLKTFYQICVENLNYSLPSTPDLSYGNLSGLDEPYCDNLIDLFKKTKVEFFEYTNQNPALVLKGGQTNVTFKYFDIRKYFSLSRKQIYITSTRNNLLQALNSSKLHNTLEKNLRKENILHEIFSNVSKDFQQLGFHFSFQIFEDIIAYVDGFISYIYSYDPRKYSYNMNFTKNEQEILKCLWDFYEQLFHDQNQKYSNHYFAYNKIYEFLKGNNKIVASDFLKKKCFEFFDWGKILEDYNKRLNENQNNKNIIKDFKNDLAHLNLCFPKKYLQGNLRNILKYNYFEKIKNIYNDDQKLKFLDNILNEKYNFIEISALAYEEKAKQGYYDLIIGKKKIDEIRLKDEYKKIDYLKYYQNNDNLKLQQNTFKIPNLKKFVSDEFNLTKLLQDINEKIKRILSQPSFEDYNYQELHQLTCKTIYSLIGDANKDLQQVSYGLSYDLIGHIFYFGLCIIWKFYTKKNWEKHEAVLKDLEKEEERLLEYFLKQTSSNYIEIDNSSMTGLMHDLKIFLKDAINRKKQDVIHKTIEEAKKNRLREEIQVELDNEFFSKNSTQSDDALLDYIKNSEKYIKAKYVQKSKKLGEIAQIEVKNLCEYFNFVSELKSCLSEIFSLLDLKFQSPEEGYSKNLFEIESNMELSGDLKLRIEEKFKTTAFTFLIDSVMGNTKFEYFEQIEIRKAEVAEMKNVKFFIKKDISDALKNIKKIENESFKQILNLLKQKSVVIMNFHYFIKKFMESTILLIEDIKNNQTCTPVELEKITNSLIFIICEKKCPCCLRVCGEEDPNHVQHKVKYGHQIRAMGGVILGNKEASVSTCSEIKDNDDIVYNGNQQTWLDFKNYYKNLATDSWSFDDTLQRENSDLVKFYMAWQRVGKKIANEFSAIGMIYVDKNIKNANVPASNSNAMHYIFLLDSSGSMSGSRWSFLKSALKQNIITVSKQNKLNSISIINFDSNAYIEYENKDPSFINVDAIPFRGGGTCFSNAYATAFDIIKNPNYKSNIQLMFMTDGENSYPQTEINNIKNYLNSQSFTMRNIGFQFFFIACECSDSDGQKFCQDLKGKIFVAKNANELGNIYAEIINKN